MIRVTLPMHLRTLARASGEVRIEIVGPGADPGTATTECVLDALETTYPTLRGTMRDPVTRRRRPYIRFFACGRDLSNEPANAPLPAAVVAGTEPFMVVGAIAGG